MTGLQKHYKLHVDYDGTHYMGLTMEWNYKEGYVDVSMPNYVPHLLERLNHPPPSKQQYSPHEHNSVRYSKKGERQLTAPIDTSTPLDGKDITKIQSIVGALLYYARAIDNTILTALNDIAATQSKPTEKCGRGVDDCWTT